MEIAFMYTVGIVGNLWFWTGCVALFINLRNPLIETVTVEPISVLPFFMTIFFWIWVFVP